VSLGTTSEAHRNEVKAHPRGGSPIEAAVLQHPQSFHPPKKNKNKYKN